MPTTVPGGYSPDDDGQVRLGKPRHLLDDAPPVIATTPMTQPVGQPVIALSDLRVHTPSSLGLSVLSNVPRVPTTRGGDDARPAHHDKDRRPTGRAPADHPRSAGPT